MFSDDRTIVASVAELTLSHQHSYTMKLKRFRFDEIFVTGCTSSCQNDNFRCMQWQKFNQNDDITISVHTLPILILISPNSSLGDGIEWRSIRICQCHLWISFEWDQVMIGINTDLSIVHYVRLIRGLLVKTFARLLIYPAFHISVHVRK